MIRRVSCDNTTTASSRAVTGVSHSGNMSFFLFLTCITCLMTHVPRVQAEDDTCLLESGGSTLRFLVSEDEELGHVVGLIKVKGNHFL